MMLFVLSLCLCASIVQGKLWRDENVKETLKMKECFNDGYASLITSLFPVASPEQEKREAEFLDSVGRMVKSGRSFCSALSVVVESTKRLLEKRLASVTAKERGPWRATLIHFRQKVKEIQSHCSFLPVEEGGILSSLNKCIDKVFLKSAKALIIAQFSEEEKVVPLKRQ